MAKTEHPFHAVGALAALRRMDRVTLMTEGDDIRLVCNDPPVFFKHRDDPSAPMDRTTLGQHKRLLLSAEDCADGPQSTLVLIEQLLEKFAGYSTERPTQKPTSGRDK